MTLSILCVTNGEPHAGQFLLRMRRLANVLGSELVIGLDGEQAQKSELRSIATIPVDLPEHDVPLQEMVIDLAVAKCSGDYVLRLDDDEATSPALEVWLVQKKYESSGNLFAFPRVYLYPDGHNILSNTGIYPDLQTRLGRKTMMYGVNSIHAGNPNGTGKIIPYAIEHYKLIIKSLEQRLEIAERYEAIRDGAGYNPVWSKYNIPEHVYVKLETKPYSSGDYSK